jgi:hypothetical protein
MRIELDIEFLHRVRVLADGKYLSKAKAEDEAEKTRAK